MFEKLILLSKKNPGSDLVLLCLLNVYWFKCTELWMVRAACFCWSQCGFRCLDTGLFGLLTCDFKLYKVNRPCSKNRAVLRFNVL